MSKKGKITKDWEKGEVEIFGKTYILPKLPLDTFAQCAFHGMCQKLGDTTASMKNYTDSEKSLAIDKVYDSLLAGNWRVPGEGSRATVKAERDKAFSAYAEANAHDQEVMRRCFKKIYEFPKELEKATVITKKKGK